jgi:hypothetical protein
VFMDDSLLPRLSDQLKLATDLIRSTVESNSSTVSREHIALGLERLLLVQELISSISKEFARLESQNNEYRHKINSALHQPVQKREAPTEPQKKASGSTLKSAKNIFPDQGLLDSYSDIAVKYGNLRREIALMRTNIESALRHLNDFWKGDGEAKNVIVEQLRKALSTNADS